MLDQRQIFVPDNPVPRTSILASSVFTHVVGLVLIIWLWHSAGPQIVPEKHIIVQTTSGSSHVAFDPASAQPRPPRAHAFHLPRKTKQARAAQPVNEGDSAGLEVLREHAKEATKGLMTNFKMRHIYGFAPGPEYQLAVQTSGVIPNIPANDLPPRFEQYLVVEVTIDIDGRVADARLITGMATPKIEKTLLSAIREFKYTPAKRDGSPIPCQIDLVIHIPS
jgi:hypothetical protein